MSDNYKIIRRVKEAALELKSQGWSSKKIYDEMKIAPRLLNEILEYDPVAVTIQAVTVEKLRVWLAGYDKLRKIQAGMEKIESKDPSGPVPNMEVTEPEVEAEFVMTRQHRGGSLDSYTITGTEMDLLKHVTDIFAEKGYRLDVHITKIFKPDDSR